MPIIIIIIILRNTQDLNLGRPSKKALRKELPTNRANNYWQYIYNWHPSRNPLTHVQLKEYKIVSCMHICMYVFVYACTDIYVHACMYICMCVIWKFYFEILFLHKLQKNYLQKSSFAQITIKFNGVLFLQDFLYISFVCSSKVSCACKICFFVLTLSLSTVLCFQLSFLMKYPIIFPKKKEIEKKTEKRVEIL